VKKIDLVMAKDNLTSIPRYDLPAGLSYRMFQKGDDAIWAEIVASAGEFATDDMAVLHFRKEFGKLQRELRNRCVFADTEEGVSIGTATAWFGDLPPGKTVGRLHWVAIKKNFQGRGIGKPLVSRALQLLSTFHECAYLTTQTTSYKAVKIYLDFGFRPYITDESQRTGWSMISRLLCLPQLNISNSL
jgi:GNAT superfamily N-acetyltransferase